VAPHLDEIEQPDAARTQNSGDNQNWGSLEQSQKDQVVAKVFITDKSVEESQKLSAVAQVFSNQRSIEPSQKLQTFAVTSGNRPWAHGMDRLAGKDDHGGAFY
jgi:hypothetical protein